MAPTRHCRPIADFSDGLPLALLLHLFLLIPGRVVAQSSPPSDNSAKFNPSMAIVILVLICAFFFLGFFSIYIRQCVGEDASVLGGAPNRGFAAARSRHLQRGLKPEVIDTFPTLVYSEVKEHKIGKAALECAVCLSEFEDDETLRLLPHCSHVFHQDCIDAWLESHVTCPVCRANLSEAAPAADPIACDHRTTSPPSNVASPEILGPSHDRRSEEQAQPEHVVIVVDRSAEEEQRKAEAIELARIGSKRRDARSRSGRRPAKFPRSHSTGHLGVQRVENLDRYTLRLPEHIRKEIFTSRKFHRSTSCVAFPTEGSARRGYRGGNGEGSSRGGGRSIRLGKSERWPSFLIRTFSTKIPAWAAGRRGDNEGSVKKGETDGSTREKIATVATPFDCLGVGAAAAGGGKAKAEVVANADESHTAALTRRV